MHSFIRGIVPAIIAISLSACSGEPSESNIREAIQNYPLLRMQMENMRRQSGHSKNAATFVDNFLKTAVIEKAGCEQLKSAEGYICSFQIGNGTGDGPLNLSPLMKGRIYKSDRGWTFERMQ
ncbi:MAG: hypothetical protein H6876_06200 [Hyphomicrobiaceae bacterium]|nr:hypothetical protein [Hyphomicrobiaceae bacterium]